MSKINDIFDFILLKSNKIHVDSLNCKYPGKKSHSLSEIFIHTDMYPEEIAMRNDLL